MPRFTIQRPLPYSVDDMYELVSEIERYPDFLRWIKRLEARKNTPSQVSNDRSMDADVTIGYGGLMETFSTRISCKYEAKRVDIKLLRGPLRRLDAVWKIEHNPATQGALVNFEMDYAFSNPFLALVAKMNMELAVNKVMQAFVEAAQRYYVSVSEKNSPTLSQGGH